MLQDRRSPEEKTHVHRSEFYVLPIDFSPLSRQINKPTFYNFYLAILATRRNIVPRRCFQPKRLCQNVGSCFAGMHSIRRVPRSKKFHRGRGTRNYTIFFRTLRWSMELWILTQSDNFFVNCNRQKSVARRQNTFENSSNSSPVFERHNFSRPRATRESPQSNDEDFQ